MMLTITVMAKNISNPAFLSHNVVANLSGSGQKRKSDEKLHRRIRIVDREPQSTSKSSGKELLLSENKMRPSKKRTAPYS